MTHPFPAHPSNIFRCVKLALRIISNGIALCQQFLSCKLVPERRELSGKLKHWADHLEDYGIDGVMDAALVALRGWSLMRPSLTS